MQTVNAYQGLLTLGVIVLLAIVLAVLLRRAGEAGRAASAEARDRLAAVEAERDGLRSDLHEARVACGRLETERDTLRGAAGRLEEKLRERDEAIAERDREISALKVTGKGLSGERDTAQAACATLTAAQAELDRRLREAGETITARDRDIGALRGDVRALTETLRAEREKFAALVENREELVTRFKAISGEILQTQGRTTTEAQKAELEKLISPFKVEIEGLRTNLKDITDKAEKERQSLGNQILVMQSKAAELAEEANGLARALRGDRKKQGNWGETILERILEAAGLIEGTHFMRQAAMRDEDGNRLIPDVIVRLPGERVVVVDSKVTLVAYQDMVQAEDPDTEAAALKRHVQAVRAHVRGLSEKRYDDLGLDSVDSVMMFLPVEGALTAALAAEPDLVVEGAEKRVHLMTPATLMPVLKIVEHLWTIDRRNRNVDEIVERAGRLHDKFALVVDSIQEIGEHLRKASGAQDTAIKRMSEGAGNVIGQMDKLRLLGAKARKTLPAELLDRAAEDAAEDAPDDDAEDRHRGAAATAPALPGG